LTYECKTYDVGWVSGFKIIDTTLTINDFKVVNGG